MNAKQFRKIAIIIILVLFAVSIFMFFLVLPSLIPGDYLEPLVVITESETIAKHVVIIADDLSDKTQYNYVMDLKSKFDDYSNIDVKIYDSLGESDKQSFYLSSALAMGCDAVIVYPVELDFVLNEIEQLYTNDIPVIVVGDYDPKPTYLSIGFKLETMGKLQAQSTYASIANSEIVIFTSSKTSESAAALLKGFTDELTNRPDIKLKKVYYTSGVSKTVLSERIADAMNYNTIVIQDAASFRQIADALCERGYSGMITGITSDRSILSYVLEYENTAIIYHGSKQLSSIVFTEVLASLYKI